MTDATSFDPTEFIAHLTTRPGVYRMLDGEGELLYVGKARNLRNRVASYFSGRPANTRIQRMLARVRRIEVTVTETEAEALLLESNLIKRHRPRYNILLRDDKSYPYIHISSGTPYPRLSFYRGARRGPGRFFGPYPSAGAVRFTLGQLQKVFRVRLCEDSYFANRSRPCLQYQIKRCSAPCVGLISPEDYQRDIADCERFLTGRSQEVIEDRIRRMEAASAALNFEAAAVYRDQIAQLRRIAQQQYVSGAKGDVDVVACVCEGGQACVTVFFVRNGNSMGHRSFFPRLPDDEAGPAEVLGAFLAQYYAGREVPPEILVNVAPPDAEVLAEMLAARREGKVGLRHRVRGERARWVGLAEQNARVALSARLASRAGQRERLEALQEALGLESPPRRMECFDISHTQGEATVASCVVFQDGEPLSSDYRRFNIRDVTAGDDYAAMRQALTRRYRRLQAGEGALPDVLFIDGGRGQLGVAAEVLADLQVQGVTLVGVAKGEGRKPGRETLFVHGQSGGVRLSANSPALLLVQQIRDEAHRFAITGHRQRRRKARTTSPLEAIPGLGAKRRQRLLQHFGGLRGVGAASVEELAKVPGISRTLAERIYAAHHPDG